MLNAALYLLVGILCFFIVDRNCYDSRTYDTGQCFLVFSVGWPLVAVILLGLLLKEAGKRVVDWNRRPKNNLEKEFFKRTS